MPLQVRRCTTLKLVQTRNELLRVVVPEEPRAKFVPNASRRFRNAKLRPPLTSP
jgi:hypothetical protein